MPSAPKCKVCGSQHRLGQPHVWLVREVAAEYAPGHPVDLTGGKANIGKTTPKPKAPPVTAVSVAVALVDERLQRLAELEAADAARKAKAATYMRGYRARTKARGGAK